MEIAENLDLCRLTTDGGERDNAYIFTWIWGLNPWYCNSPSNHKLRTLFEADMVGRNTDLWRNPHLICTAHNPHRLRASEYVLINRSHRTCEETEHHA